MLVMPWAAFVYLSQAMTSGKMAATTSDRSIMEERTKALGSKPAELSSHAPYGPH